MQADDDHQNAAPSNGRVVLAGGSGFLGRGLAPHLEDHGYDITVLSRSPLRDPSFPTPVRWAPWDATTLGPWKDELEGAVAVVNLVGRSVDCLKTPENKSEILSSRLDSCRVLGEAMRAIANPPPVWIQGTTAHIVGDPKPLDRVCDDATPPGPQDEFAPSVGVAWEQAFDDAKLTGQRGVTMRISFVLGPDGGALQRLHMLTRRWLGGSVGSGRQWISWIHQDDLNRIILNAIEDDTHQGVYMVTSPNPVTNRVFMRAMRRTHGRPWSPPAPRFAVRLAARFALKTDPELALKGRRCVPTRLNEEHGFEFEHDEVEAALKDLRDR